ncbi:MAG: hypothetical protein L6Q37_09340 [Bdellovibrionaceae bacterium]|nr:hypothetical protein [Pseudobdellovibrionaceae bacterium]NUM57249.1 acyl-protein synthase [Pseudobdellovibrionaceae bacterium]
MKNKEFKIPDKKKLGEVEQLCLITEPYKKSQKIDLHFTQAMREVLLWHQQKSIFFSNFLKSQNFDIESWNGDIAFLPYLPTDFFKRHEVKTIQDNEVYLHLTSSGTTGQKSQIFFDEWSLKSAQSMVDNIFSYYGWTSDEKTNYLLYTYQTESDSTLGTAYTDNYLTQYAPINRLDFALKLNGKGGHDFDLYGCLQSLKQFAKEQLPLRIFGFPSFLYFTLQRMKDLKFPPLKFPDNSLVFLGGGWKGYAGDEISKKQLYQMIHDLLGIPDSRIRDGFGSVEHCIPYVECKFHHFHVPIYSKVLIRDLYTLDVLGYNKEGFLQFVSPYITSVPANSVLMGDLAILRKGHDCGCGLENDWFEVLGRAGVSKNKSCAIAANELLRSFV